VRANLVTEAYQKYVGKVSFPVLRALAFKQVLENKVIYIAEGELIMGERGEAPKATLIYPELCCHSIEDLELINSEGRFF
jgi:formate C-acetyltransferase